MNTYTSPITRSITLIVLLLALCRTGMYATTDKQTETLRAKADMLHAHGKNDSAMIVAERCSTRQ